MTKMETIEAIRLHNPSAQREFLGDFNHHQLDSYLRRLELLKGEQGRGRAWVREGDTPAVVTRKAG